MRTIPRLLLTLLVMGATAWPLRAQRTEGSVSTTEVSGIRARVEWVALPEGGLVMGGVQWMEEGNKPCGMVLLTRSLTDQSNGSFSAHRPAFDICDREDVGVPMRRDDSFREVKQTGVGVYIGGIQVCRSNDRGHRLKGVTLLARSVTIAHPPGRPNTVQTSDLTGYPSEAHQRNCQISLSPVRCGQNEIATGLAVNYNDDGIVGLALRCRPMRP